MVNLELTESVENPSKHGMPKTLQKEKCLRPTGLIKSSGKLAPLAQLVEHRTFNPLVPSSSLGGRTVKGASCPLVLVRHFSTAKREDQKLVGT